MKLLTPKQMKAIDRKAITEYMIPGVILMEHAAMGITKIAMEMLKINNANKNKISIVCGKGNNGGDGFACARILRGFKYDVQVFILFEKQEIEGDAKINLDIIDKQGIEIYYIKENSYDLFETRIMESDLIIDAILGTGIRGDLSSHVKKVIRIINSIDRAVLAVDIPSGVNGETGEVRDIAIKATKTVTLAFSKTGLYIHPGCEYTGSVFVADIGIGEELLDGCDYAELIDNQMVKEFLPCRKQNSNKSDFGRALVITGSKGMTGAGILSAKATLRSGVGLLYLAVPNSLTAIYATSVIEAITFGIQDRDGFMISFNELLDKSKPMDTVLIGPGLSQDENTKKAVYDFIGQTDKKLVIDADALNAVSKDVSILKKIKNEKILTPHPGEMARLAKITVEEVQKNRIEVARKFAVENKAIVALKGAKTVIADVDGKVYINPTGDSGLATAGTGDVLAGLITGLLAQGVSPIKATIAGVYLHGLAGNISSDKKTKYAVIASDVIDNIGEAIKIVQEY